MTSASGTQRSHARRAWSELMLWTPPAILVIAGWRARWVADDAFIDMRIIQNLLHGLGPVFNAGERVEAFTSPAWVAIVAAVGGLAGLVSGNRLSLEWVAVLLGLGFSYVALAAAGLAALRLWRLADSSGQADERWLAPLGALAIACIAPYWDFATSGLECSLVLAWLALSFWGSTLLLEPCRLRTKLWLGVLFAVGPLVRPDLLIAAGIWIGLLLLSLHGLRTRALAAVTALALPVGYEVFRMGYFAATVPNTAIAKEASLSYWPQGKAYLIDFITPYSLPLLLALFGVALAALGWRLWRGSEAGWRWRLLLAAAPVLAGALQGIYVVRVGGDFMHGRMLLPPLFALSLPVSVIVVDGLPAVVLGALGGAYALTALAFFRCPYDRWAKGGAGWIGNERGIYVQGAKNPNPVDLSDYRAATWASNGEKLGKLAEDLRRKGNAGAGMYSEGFNGNPRPAHLPSDAAATLVAVRSNIGEFSYAAGPLVYVCDPHGLPDVVGSRERLIERGQPGHEKWVGQEWCIAHRLTDGDAAGANEEKVEAARAALACGDLRELVEAVDQPLTLRRFLRNLGDARRLTKLRIPQNPLEAKKELCGT